MKKNLITLTLITLFSSSAFARIVTQTVATESEQCNKDGCFQIQAGELRFYEAAAGAELEFYGGVLARTTDYRGITLPQGVGVEFRGILDGFRNGFVDLNLAAPTRFGFLELAAGRAYIEISTPMSKALSIGGMLHSEVVVQGIGFKERISINVNFADLLGNQPDRVAYVTGISSGGRFVPTSRATTKIVVRYGDSVVLSDVLQVTTPNITTYQYYRLLPSVAQVYSRSTGSAVRLKTYPTELLRTDAQTQYVYFDMLTFRPDATLQQVELNASSRARVNGVALYSEAEDGRYHVFNGAFLHLRPSGAAAIVSSSNVRDNLKLIPDSLEAELLALEADRGEKVEMYFIFDQNGVLKGFVDKFHKGYFRVDLSSGEPSFTEVKRTEREIYDLLSFSIRYASDDEDELFAAIEKM